MRSRLGAAFAILGESSRSRRSAVDYDADVGKSNADDNHTFNSTESKKLVRGLVPENIRYPPEHPSLTKMATLSNGSIVCPHMFTHFSNAYYFTSIVQGVNIIFYKI